MEWLKGTAEITRRHVWAWRVGEEMRYRSEDRWFPIFITLTVDPSRADGRAIMESGDEWRRFRVRVAEVVRQALGFEQVSRGGPPVSTYFRYCAIVEHGASREHHHLHAMLWLKDMPAWWKLDPNVGRASPNAVEIVALKALWPWATVTKMIAFRHVGDIWSSLGWMWPVTPDGRGLPARTAQGSGEYLAKYLGKDAKEWHHRMKATRGLGLERLQALLQRLRLTQTLALLEAPVTLEEKAKKDCSTVPLATLRALALRLSISKAQRTSYSRGLLKTLAWTMPKFDSWSAMSRSVVDGVTPWSMDGVERFDWLSQMLRPVGLVSFRDRREVVWKMLAREFPVLVGMPQTAVAGVTLRDAAG